MNLMKTKIIHKFFYLLAFIYLIEASSCSQNNTKLPILIIATDSDFGTYTVEILKTEGFNSFMVDSLNSGKITSSYLKQFDLIILTECKIESTSKKMFEEYVKDGGNLIAFRPDTTISELFGITPVGGNIHEGYIAVDTNAEQGKGVTSEIMQFHGVADKYSISNAKSIATLLVDKLSNKGFPGVVSNNYGKGHTIAFLYNLPKSIVYTRQGNPLSAGIEKDGIPGLRGMDLFTDGWVDNSKNTLNQADQQMTLLSNCIQKLNKNTKPLPRLWYFPDTLNCLAVLDNDGEDNNETDFESQFRDIDSMGAKMTIYIKDVDKVSKEWVDKWTSKGFEIAGHPDDTRNATNPTWNSMDRALQYKIDQINTEYGLDVRTNVNHWFVWCGNDENGQQDFGAQARLEAIHGIEMDGNYAHYDINSNQVSHYLGAPGINQGNFTGSGLVMKYADTKGRTVNVYQRFNSVYDQQYMETKNHEGFFNSFKGLVDRSLNDEIYSIISIKSHNDEYYFSKKPLMKMLAYANEKGIPVWTALNLLNFLKMKDEASFTNFSWLNNRLSFSLNSSLKHSHGLTFMFPASYLGMKIKGVAIDGQENPVSVRSVKGSEYAFATVKPGANYAIQVVYGK